MANVVRARAELKVWTHPGQSHKDRKYAEIRAFKTMMQEFKRQVNETGVVKEARDRMFFESKAEKDKRKRKESQLKAWRDQQWEDRKKDKE